MNPISSLSYAALGFLAAWQMLLLLGSVWILSVDCREKRQLNPVLRNMLVLLLAAVNYLLFQFTADRISGKARRPLVILIEQPYAELPVFCVVGICFLLTVVEVLMILVIRRWNQTHITSFSIKEAIETLPVGVCAYEASGKITLKNTTMEILCRRLTGEALLNGNEFVQSLTVKCSGIVDHTVDLPDFGVWSFKKDHIIDKRNDFTLLVAYNVTEAYQKTQTLNEKRQTVERLNAKLTAYNKRIESVVAEKEILTAKIKIHDELGADLLAIKRYLAKNGDAQTKAEILNRANRNISFLLEKDAVATDEYELMLTTAKALGVTVEIDGFLPEIQPHKHIIATAIHECLTNTLRHAQGDLLHICVRDTGKNIEAEFTNNGWQPDGEIHENCGLTALRILTEKSHGTMMISTTPRFILTISLPKEEANNVI